MNGTTFDPSPLAAVTYRQDGDRWTLIFVRDLRHPPDRVWAALTDPAQLREWAPFVTDRDLGSVGPATLTMIDGDSREQLPAAVSRAERPRLLEYTWGTDFVRWELTRVTIGTRLTLEHTVEDPEWMPKVAAGWHLCLDVAEHLLDGKPIAPIRGDEALKHGWGDLHEAYSERLGVRSTRARDDVEAP